jgi:hypothetical protein
MSELPEWAKEIVPLTHDQAAQVLGVSRRKLWTILKDHPHFERRGRANVYYPEHIRELRQVGSTPPAKRKIRRSDEDRSNHIKQLLKKAKDKH